MGSPKSYKTIEIEQQCKFGFDVEYVQNLVDTWSVVKDYAWALHNMDDAEEHIHLMIRFNNSVPTTAILAKLQGVCKENNLQKMHNWNSAIAYLTHANVPEKYQYPDSAVISNYDWQKDRDAAITDKIQKQKVFDAIANGQCKDYNVTDFCTMEFYSKYRKQIADAIDYRIRQLEQERKDREMQVLYMTGSSGTGKTTYAKILCKGRGWTYFVSSSSNDVLDGYKGEDCIILDDFRPSDWSIADLLKFLDNNTNSRVKSRYSNKSMVYCKAVIITSVLSVDDLYKKLRERENEPIKQLKRRIGGVMVLTQSDITCKKFDPVTEDHTKVYKPIPNPCSDLFKDKTGFDFGAFLGIELEPDSDSDSELELVL